MRITEVRTTQVRVPLNVKAKWSGGTREAAPALVVELLTDEGLVGLGECAGPSIPLLRAAVNEELRPYLVGADPMRTAWLLQRMEEHVVNWPGVGAHAIAGVEIALLDLKAKALGVPLYELLGGASRQRVSWAGYIFIDTPEVNARQAASYVSAGFREIKVKVGRDPELDMRRLGAIREAVGSDVKLRIDVNQGWSVPTAVKWIRRMEQFDLQYVEQPTPWYDLEGMRQVSESVGVP
ncbi:MAG: mandelate racemase/muconate lactonizing enzyme family protein, partial [Armatimonadota bacterium]|nr:mandelate racemase/muconate lactonizing enzyme family protein [Armatimonadota bacterium]